MPSDDIIHRVTNEASPVYEQQEVEYAPYRVRYYIAEREG